MISTPKKTQIVELAINHANLQKNKNICLNVARSVLMHYLGS